MAEHNGNYSASLKNVFDWCTRISGKVFQEKPCCWWQVPGAKGGASALEIAKKAFPFYGNIKATFHSSFDDNFDAKISNAELDEQLKEIVRDFQM
jgi:NAD(P)H-dependent FMN reductase